jgi:hypothetical protein
MSYAYPERRYEPSIDRMFRFAFDPAVTMIWTQ